MPLTRCPCTPMRFALRGPDPAPEGGRQVVRRIATANTHGRRRLRHPLERGLCQIGVAQLSVQPTVLEVPNPGPGQRGGRDPNWRGNGLQRGREGTRRHRTRQRCDGRVSVASLQN